MYTPHPTAMLEETISGLTCMPGHVVVDCTLGGCGHALAVCERIGPEGLLIGIDQDAEAIENARNILSRYRDRVKLVHEDFSMLPVILQQMHIEGVNGIVMDLGMSRHHLEGSCRGFSFQKDEPLDMRMDVRQTVTAETLLRTLNEDELTDVFYRFGEERYARRIAGAIVRSRKKRPLLTSGQLAAVVLEALPAKARNQHIHPATRVFMALRIVVNRELEKLERFLQAVPDCLVSGGRLCILSFHSLEDRIVKRYFRQWEGRCICAPGIPKCVCNRSTSMRPVYRRCLRPSPDEIAKNPLARSTRLRIAEKR